MTHVRKLQQALACAALTLSVAACSRGAPIRGEVGTSAEAVTGTGCSGTTFFCDDFTSAALAQDYATYNGTWVRGSGSYTVTDASQWQRAQATLPYAVTDFDVTFSGQTMGDYGFGLIYAATANQNEGYAVVVHPAQFQGIYLKQLIPGQNDVNIAQTPLPAGLAGQELTVRIKRVASNVTVWLNGTQMLSASDGSSGAGGTLGLLLSDTNNTAGGGAVFNLLRVDSATPVPCSGSAFFCDDFTNPALAQDYATYNGTWVRGTGNYTVTDGNQWQRAQATLPYDVTNFDVTFTGQTMGDYGFGLIYGATANQNQGYAVVVHPAQFQGVYLKQLIPGQNDVNIAQTPLPAGFAGEELIVRVTRVGSNVTVWLNGTQMLSASDGSSGAGGVLGLLLSDTNNTAGGGAIFNQLRVDSATTVGGDAGAPVDAGSPPPPTGGTVNAAPTGPTTPTGGWHVDFADDFNAPLGTGAGQDNFWYPTQPWNGTPTNNVPGNNSYETEVYNSSQVSVSGGFLGLTAVYDGSQYVSGIVTSPIGIPGYQGFTWTPGDGSTWAFEIVCQWPVDTGELFNAWWSSTQSGWTDERDFFEGHQNTGGIDSDWIYVTSPVTQDYYETTLGFDPSAASHRYTYVVNSDQSWSTFIDGNLQGWVGNNGVSQPESSADAPMMLIINYALSATTFTSGSRTFLIDSVAVYQDGAHAGQSIAGGGIAPGTVVGQ